MYSFDHWLPKDGSYAAVHNMPSHKTQLISYVTKEEFEVIDRREWNL